MNVTVNDVGPCKKLMRVEIPAADVDAAFAEVEKDFQKHASLPGFRKGKTPLAMVQKSFEKDILEEAQKKMVSSSYREAIKQQNLSVCNLVNLEDIQFERGKPMQFAATVEVNPQFELPAYRGLPARREVREVTEADIDHAIELLRNRMATFQKVDREAKADDIVVANYAGRCEDKPIEELAPASRGLAAQKNFWIEIKEGSFIPGFAQQLLGATAGSRRTVTVDFPGDFVSAPLAGKKGLYEVEVVEVKERVLPPLDDAFAKSWEATDVKSLREGVRQDLQHELNEKLSRSVRDQVVRALTGPLNFDLPESAVLAETRNVVYEIVRENQQRGVTKETIDKNKDEIFNLAKTAAHERMKAIYIFQKIAEKEGIKIEQAEFDARLFTMAKSLQMTPDKLLKEMQKRDGVEHLVQQIVNEKVIDFLQQNARVEDVPAEEPKA